MPGSITLRPIEAKLTHETGVINSMDPYCAFVVGEDVFRGEVSVKGGKHPHWDDSVVIPFDKKSQINEITLELMDRVRFSTDNHIGRLSLNINELENNGQSSKWYPLTFNNKPAGEILLEASFTGLSPAAKKTVEVVQPVKPVQPVKTVKTVTTVEEKVIVTVPVTPPKAIVEEVAIIEAPLSDRKVYTEQTQVVEPRTFMKEVDVVEIRQSMQKIEVMKPVKVLKDVTYTDAVSVLKRIEVTEPVIVVKEVEVMEPRLVTKTIQVVENVPVMRKVEVVEYVTRVKEVETFEPQTFTKQVEVTEYVPTQEKVTVTEPVHLKKAVEYVEPVITTKTIIKEIMEPVIVGEKITTTVGPSSVIGESQVYGERFSYFAELAAEERLLRTAEYLKLRETGLTDIEIEKNFELRGWVNLINKKVNKMQL